MQEGKEKEEEVGERRGGEVLGEFAGFQNEVATGCWGVSGNTETYISVHTVRTGAAHTGRTF